MNNRFNFDIWYIYFSISSASISLLTRDIIYRNVSELIYKNKKFLPDNSARPLFSFSKKYKVKNLLKSEEVKQPTNSGKKSEQTDKRGN